MDPYPAGPPPNTFVVPKPTRAELVARIAEALDSVKAAAAAAYFVGATVDDIQAAVVEGWRQFEHSPYARDRRLAAAGQDTDAVAA